MLQILADDHHKGLMCSKCPACMDCDTVPGTPRIKPGYAVSRNDEFCIENEESLMKNKELRIKTKNCVFKMVYCADRRAAGGVRGHGAF